MRLISALLLTLALMGGWGARLGMAQADRLATLQIGDPAPDFVLTDDQGKPRRLSEYRGRTVVLMFYPKDFTPG